MGCSESKNEKEEEEEEEALSHFKQRLHFIKEAVTNHNAFFAALSAYGICLKNIGAAFTDGTHPHFSHPPSSSVYRLRPSPSPHPLPLPLPPPPLPNALMQPVRMPEIKPEPIIEEDELELESEGLPRKQKFKEMAIQATIMHHRSAWDYFFPLEDVTEEEEEEEKEQKVELPVPVPVRPVMKKRVREISSRSRQPDLVSSMQIFGDLDNHFLKAFQSTLEVSQMFNSPSNFHDNQPNNDHIEKIQTLSTVLNRLLVWETKLYEQIKVGEVIKYDYQKKVSLLNKQKKQATNPNSFDKLNASISHLRTRYIVEMQSAVSTAAKINRIRDEQLHLKLVQLVDQMATMWESMLFHHESQLKIVLPLKSLGNPQAMNESSKYRYDCTIQLCGAVRGWHTQFCGIIEYQKDSIRALHRWLQLSLVPIETHLEGKMNSLMAKSAPIHELVIAWKNDLDQLPDEAARNAIRNFASVIQTIVNGQEKYMKLRETGQAIPEELAQKSTHKQETEQACQTISKPVVKNKSLASLKHSLPDFFRALSEIAQACSGMYHNLINVAENQYKEREGEKKDDVKHVSIYEMNMHCAGCVMKIRKAVKLLEGVEAIKMDCKANRLMVTGKIDPAKVKAMIEEKMKRKVDIVSRWRWW